LAEALSLLGVRRALVVCGDDGLDEVTLGGTTHVSEVSAGRPPREFTWRPEDFGLPPAGREEMLVDGPEASAALIRRILDGEPGPPRDVTVLNAAAGLWTAGRAATPAECAALARQAIDGGAAKNLLAQLVERSRR
jgi:anthranilate phosphoribosyltransferase